MIVSNGFFFPKTDPIQFVNITNPNGNGYILPEN